MNRHEARREALRAEGSFCSQDLLNQITRLHTSGNQIPFHEGTAPSQETLQLRQFFSQTDTLFLPDLSSEVALDEFLGPRYSTLFEGVFSGERAKQWNHLEFILLCRDRGTPDQLKLAHLLHRGTDPGGRLLAEPVGTLGTPDLFSCLKNPGEPAQLLPKSLECAVLVLLNARRIAGMQSLREYREALLSAGAFSAVLQENARKMSLNPVGVRDFHDHQVNRLLSIHPKYLLPVLFEFLGG